MKEFNNELFGQLFDQYASLNEFINDFPNTISQEQKLKIKLYYIQLQSVRMVLKEDWEIILSAPPLLNILQDYSENIIAMQTLHQKIFNNS